MPSKPHTHPQQISRRPKFTLRAKLIAYYLLLHLLLATAAAFLFLERPPWLFTAELLLILSLILGYALIRALFVPLQLIGLGADMLEEEEFTVHFRPVDQPELDRLLQVYNTMVDRLREERIRVQEQNELLDRVISASPGGIVVCDLDAKIRSANPAALALLGWEPEEAIGKDPGQHELLRPALAAEPGRPVIVPRPVSRRFRVTRSEFRDRGFPRTLFLVEELTEELLRSEREAYGQVIRLVAHEVNNSVGPVSSLVETVRFYADRLESEERRRFEAGLDLAAQRLEHLRGFVEGFAEVVKLPEPQRTHCDLDRMVADLLTLIAPTLEGQGIQHHLQAEAPLGWAKVDKNQLEQVLVNVLKNAAEACTEGGQITLRTVEDHGRSRLEIKDTGPGLSPAAQESLFRPFFTTKNRGRGLGLTLVHQILRAHDFDFSLENHPAGGAVFRLDFPSSSPSSGSAPEAQS